ncbi:MAG: hypothetical protein K5768_08445 [Firmicutes bacterium]|nr:hypothetical protein [Bacillota bacterium]
MRIKRLLVSAIIVIACVVGLSQTAYADTINADGSPASTGFMLEGITVNQGGSLVYLVDTDGNYVGYSESLLYGNSGALSTMVHDGQNMVCIQARVSGISTPSSCKAVAPWGPSYAYDGKDWQSTVNTIRAFFKETGSNGKSKGYNFIADKWGADAANKYVNGEIAIAIELVTSCRFGYQCVYRDSTSNTKPTPKSASEVVIEAMEKYIDTWYSKFGGELDEYDGTHSALISYCRANRSKKVTYEIKFKDRVIAVHFSLSLLEDYLTNGYSNIHSTEKEELEEKVYQDMYAGGGEGSYNSDYTGQVYHYFTNGVKRVIGTPRNIEKYYRDNGGMTKERGKFGYRSYKTVMSANNATVKGFPADTLAVVSWFGFSDGRLGSYSWEIVNNNGKVIKVTDTNGSKFTHGFNGSGGWTALLKTFHLQEAVSNLSLFGRSSYDKYGNAHSAEGIILITATDEIPTEEAEVYDGNFVIHQSELIKKVDLFNDIHGNALVAGTYKWKKPKQSFLCSDVIDKDDEKVTHGVSSDSNHSHS